MAIDLPISLMGYYLNFYLVKSGVRKAYLAMDNDIVDCTRIIEDYFRDDLRIIPLIGESITFLIVRNDNETDDFFTPEKIAILSDHTNPRREIELGTVLGYSCPSEQLLNKNRVSFRYSATFLNNEKVQLYAYICTGIKHLEEAIAKLNEIKVAFERDEYLNSLNLQVGLEIVYLKRLGGTGPLMGGKSRRVRKRKTIRRKNIKRSHSKKRH